MSVDSANSFNTQLFNSFYNFNAGTAPVFNYNFPVMQNSGFGTGFWTNFQQTCSEWMQNIVNQNMQFSLNTVQTQPIFNFDTSATTPFMSYIPTYSSSSGVSDSKKASSKTKNKSSGGKGTATSEYATLSKKEAEKKAAKDSNLECLKAGGKGWSISENNFINDIPYAAKGTGAILAKVAKELGVNLVVTSALGTSSSPHDKTIAFSHYDAENPKLDIRGGADLAKKLEKTGYFSEVTFEGDHIDLRIKDSALAEINKKELDTLA